MNFAELLMVLPSHQPAAPRLSTTCLPQTQPSKPLLLPHRSIPPFSFAPAPHTKSSLDSHHHPTPPAFLRAHLFPLLLQRSPSQGGCGVSFSGDIQAPPGQGPVQPAVGDPASAGGLD